MLLWAIYQWKHARFESVFYAISNAKAAPDFPDAAFQRFCLFLAASVVLVFGVLGFAFFGLFLLRLSAGHTDHATVFLHAHQAHALRVAALDGNGTDRRADDGAIVRDEQDIRSLAVEIATLTRRQQRGKGLRMA